MSSCPLPPLSLSASSCLLLGLSGGAPDPESADYVENKTQFQLHSMLTEQRHHNTTNMSQTMEKDIQSGLSQLFSVDDDISLKLRSLLADPAAVHTMHALTSAFQKAIIQKKRIYIYGCGATGRLAKLMESTFWRPFWSRVQSRPEIWAKVSPHVSDSVREDMVGEMTGADRALIASLEGFEDLQLIGALQLQEHGIRAGDVVVGVTEGGETSSVIGTVREAVRTWDEVKEQASAEQIAAHVFFVYNNPDALLLPFVRSASVITDARISKLNLSTGPQAITGSTRMQATSSETFVIATCLQRALETVLRDTCGLNSAELQTLGFSAESSSLEVKMQEFPSILAAVKQAIPDLSLFTQWEAETYQSNHFTTYFANSGLMTVFIDNTERSPTFRLYALDTISMKQRMCWLQVWTSANDQQHAWASFLGRPFRGLQDSHYRLPFQSQVSDPYLREVALRSLDSAGTEQGKLYDFSFSKENINREGKAPKQGDLGVLVLVGGEEKALEDEQSDPSQFVRMFLAGKEADQGQPMRLAILVLTEENPAGTPSVRDSLLSLFSRQSLPLSRLSLTVVSLPRSGDALGLRAQLALKLALNAHSTAVMSLRGKVLGNCMVNVSPSNLKLIGRATFLIQSLANATADKCGMQTLDYPLVNAVLYDSIRAIKKRQERKEAEAAAAAAASTSASAAAPPSVLPAGGQSAEVSLSIVRILLSLSRGAPCTAEEALTLLDTQELGQFLQEFEAKYSKQ